MPLMASLGMEDAIAVQAAALSHKLSDATEAGNTQEVYRLLKSNSLHKEVTQAPCSC